VSSEQSLTDNIKLTDPEHPVVGARIWGVSPAEAGIADFLLKIANFRCHGNNGLSEPNVTGTVELADPENHTIEPTRSSAIAGRPCDATACQG